MLRHLRSLVLFVSILFPAGAAETEKVANFSLLDYRGKYHELRATDSKAVVLFFTGNGCPIARQSIPKLQSIRKKFGEDVQLLLINSNPQDDRKSVEAEAGELHIWPLPVLLDEYQIVARSLGVKHTCETIAIDTHSWTVFYRGAIDDQMIPGAKKPEPSQTYLASALTEFLAGKTITTAKTEAQGCAIHFDDSDKAVTYTSDVAPILASKCVGCHSPGNIGPFAMLNYQKVKGWSDTIQEVLATRRMPPWHADAHQGVFQNDRSLSTTETKTLLHWVEQGAPRGIGEDPLENHLPAPAGEWPNGTPDYVIKLPQPEEIPAVGVLDYRHRLVKSTLEEDQWLSGIYVKPDNRKVLHHLIIRLKGVKQRSEEKEVFLVGWAPGNMQPLFPPGAGKLLPKGAKFDVELHYTTNGKAETDQSEVGLYFAKEPPKVVIETRAAVNLDFNVPPGESDLQSHAIMGFHRDTMLYDVTPHMHLRGSWFKYEALYPNGTREVLLSVPHYDFNWQTEYRFTEPKRMPAGTWLLCTGAFDNSAHNANNPNPAKRVHHGEQSFDEMFMGFMNVAEIPESKSLTSATP